MQVIHNRVQDLYILFTRWGGVGETGMFQKTPFNSMEEAVEEFKKIFKSKTSNLWEHRFSEEFIPKDGRFVVTKLAEKTKPLALKPLDLSKSPRSKLPHSVQDTLKVFCDIASMNKMVDDEKLDLPLGYLTAATVEEGYQLLMEIRDQIKQMEVKKTTTNGILDVKAIKAIRHKLVQLSNQYYTRIPNKDYIRTGIRPLVDLSNVQKEMQRIDNIRYLNSGANMLLGAELRGKEINPLDYCYRAFQCRMDEVEPETEEYKVVSRYMDTTAKNNDYEIIHLFGLDRAGERARFEPFSDDKNRRLLWHGSRLSNFMGILSQGLRVAPFEAEVTGYMFGKGIYFGDMFCKSINYAQEWRSAAGTQAYSCLLLCEVALGDMYEREHSEYMDHAQPGFLSTKGLGMEGPEDNMSLHVRRDGVIIPQGPPTRYEYKKRLDEDGEEISRVLSFNEYIVYDRTQVKMRYLVLVRDKNYCFLCDKSVGSNSVMPLKEFKFKSLPNGVLAGNEYEKLVVKTYLRHEGMTSQELFDGYLEARVLKTEAYRDKWQPVTQLLPTSKVCSGCANDVMNILVYETLTQKKAALPAGVSLRPNCWYGQECRAQGTLKHTMHYNHICRRTKFDDKEEEAAARKRKMRYIVGSDGEDAEDDDGESEDDDEEDEEADEDDEDYDSMAEFIFEDDIER
ncbi:poly polymerase catalytic domain-containing protein [Jimgerdemannia flammicorona]|uniref:Poly [ADP-ribose] polymerase n=1 Tax=Jimgerdemannia flammicorona TaxID=994334 RepID=A0A433DAX9_9FUNG|nr:poly polymerase catalytic domain-containing protein [Jimgerdemannia flammicorona]